MAQIQKTVLRQVRHSLQDISCAIQKRHVSHLNSQHFYLMQTPPVLRMLGWEDLPIKADGAVFQKILSGAHGHIISPAMLQKLPLAIADPIMVLRARHPETLKFQENRAIIVTDLVDADGSTVIVPMIRHIHTDDRKLTDEEYEWCHKILSTYGRSIDRQQDGVWTKGNDNGWFLRRMNSRFLLYINKKRTNRWLRTTVQAETRNGLRTVDSFHLSPIIADETALGKFCRTMKKETSSLAATQQARLDAIFQAPPERHTPERIYRSTMQEALQGFPHPQLADIHDAEQKAIRVLIGKDITKSRIKKILKERSPLCDSRQSKQDLCEAYEKTNASGRN